MRKIIAFCFLFIVLSGWLTEKEVPENKMEKFNWMIGSWKLETKRGIIIETWINTNDSTLSGESVRVNLTGGTDLLETVQITSRNKEYFYTPIAKGQNEDKPVIFKITSVGKSGFVAENPEHDFPKRISYQLITEDSIHAFIDGGPAMPEKKSDFYYSKFKN